MALCRHDDTRSAQRRAFWAARAPFWGSVTLFCSALPLAGAILLFGCALWTFPARDSDGDFDIAVAAFDCPRAAFASFDAGPLRVVVALKAATLALRHR
jgi:hypothetical protein